MTTETAHSFPGVARGASQTGTRPQEQPHARRHRGCFEDTLPVFARDHPEPAAFLHIDADLYSSTKTIFDLLGPRVVAGTVIQFDEFFNYPGWKQGEYLAFKEFCDRRQVAVRYLGYTTLNVPAQIALVVVSVGN